VEQIYTSPMFDNYSLPMDDTYSLTDRIWIHRQKASALRNAKLMLISDLLLPGRVDQHEELMHTCIKSYADIDKTFSHEFWEPEYTDGPIVHKLKRMNNSDRDYVSVEEEPAIMERIIHNASAWMQEPICDLSVATSHKYSSENPNHILKISVHIVGKKKYNSPFHFIETCRIRDLPEWFDESVYNIQSSRKFRCINSASSDGRVMLPYQQQLTAENISNYIVQSKSLCVLPFITSIPRFDELKITNVSPKKVSVPETMKLTNILKLATEYKINVKGGYNQWLSCIFHARVENVPKEIVMGWSKTVRPQHDAQKVSSTYDRAKPVGKSKVPQRGIYLFIMPYLPF
jgi:hypothetical protein